MPDTGTSNSEYDVAFRKGSRLVEGILNVDGRALPKPGFFERRRLAKALGFFAQAARVEPPFGAASFMAAKVEERLGHPEDSLGWLRMAQTEAPGNVIVSIELGAALSRRGLHAEAVRVLSPAAELNPEDPRVHCNLGLAHLMSGSGSEAASAFERTIALEPDRPLNLKLLELAADVRDGRRAAPKSEADILRSL